MANSNATRIPQIIEKHEADLLSEWIREQTAVRRTGTFSEAELKSHCTEFLKLLTDALKSGGIDLKDHLSAIEVGLIRKALEEADGTVAEAARLLKIRRTTLVEKLRKRGMITPAAARRDAQGQPIIDMEAMNDLDDGGPEISN